MNDPCLFCFSAHVAAYFWMQGQFTMSLPSLGLSLELSSENWAGCRPSMRKTIHSPQLFFWLSFFLSPYSAFFFSSLNITTLFVSSLISFLKEPLPPIIHIWTRWTFLKTPSHHTWLGLRPLNLFFLFFAIFCSVILNLKTGKRYKRLFDIDLFCS